MRQFKRAMSHTYNMKSNNIIKIAFDSSSGGMHYSF